VADRPKVRVPVVVRERMGTTQLQAVFVSSLVNGNANQCWAWDEAQGTHMVKPVTAERQSTPVERERADAFIATLPLTVAPLIPWPVNGVWEYHTRDRFANYRYEQTQLPE
jgi:hypothetical protein